MIILFLLIFVNKFVWCATNHVMFIGLRGFVDSSANTNNILETTFRFEESTSTNINSDFTEYSTMLTGVCPINHEVLSPNNFIKNNFLKYPHYFTQFPNKRKASISPWCLLENSDLMKNAINIQYDLQRCTGNDTAVVDLLTKIFEDEAAYPYPYDIIQIFFSDLKDVLIDNSYTSKTYKSVLQKKDSQIGKIKDLLKSRSVLKGEKWLLLIASGEISIVDESQKYGIVPLVMEEIANGNSINKFNENKFSLYDNKDEVVSVTAIPHLVAEYLSATIESNPWNSAYKRCTSFNSLYQALFDYTWFFLLSIFFVIFISVLLLVFFVLFLYCTFRNIKVNKKLKENNYVPPEVELSDDEKALSEHSDFSNKENSDSTSHGVADKKNKKSRKKKQSKKKERLKIVKLKQFNEQQEKVISEMKREISGLKGRNLIYLKIMTDMEDKIDFTEKYFDIVEEKLRIIKKNEKIKVRDFSNELLKKHEELKNLKKRFDKEGIRAYYEEETKKKEEEIKRYVERIERLKEKCGRKNRKNETLKKNISTKRKHNATLKKELSTANKRLHKGEKLLKKTNRKVTMLEEALKESRREVLENKKKNFQKNILARKEKEFLELKKKVDSFVEVIKAMESEKESLKANEKHQREVISGYKMSIKEIEMRMVSEISDDEKVKMIVESQRDEIEKKISEIEGYKKNERLNKIKIFNLESKLSLKMKVLAEVNEGKEKEVSKIKQYVALIGKMKSVISKKVKETEINNELIKSLENQLNTLRYHLKKANIDIDENVKIDDDELERGLMTDSESDVETEVESDEDSEYSEDEEDAPGSGTSYSESDEGTKSESVRRGGSDDEEEEEEGDDEEEEGSESGSGSERSESEGGKLNRSLSELEKMKPLPKLSENETEESESDVSESDKDVNKK